MVPGVFQDRVWEENLEMKLYTRYVDVENIICEAILETKNSPEEESDKRTIRAPNKCLQETVDNGYRKGVVIILSHYALFQFLILIHIFSSYY